MPPEHKTVPDILREGAATYEQRQKVYGPNYKHFGQVMRGFFPEGLRLETEADWVRLGIFQNCVTKMGRYAGTLTQGGHADSAHDLMVYAAMLMEVVDE